MKNLLLTLLAIIPLCCPAHTAKVFNPGAKHILSRQAKLSDAELGDNMLLLAKLADDDSERQLMEIGGQILRRRDDLVLITVPYANIDLLEQRSIITAAQVSMRASITNDMAMASAGIDKIHNGIELDRPYTGKGVVVGFSDSGFDPNHINFLNADETPRTAVVTHFRSYPYAAIKAETPEDIAIWGTDNENMFHATHVGGIIAGKCSRTPYTGAAPGATLVATTSSLYDAEILMGVEEIVAYAKEQGMPAVINLSLSNTVGPHDGSDLFSQYLDKIAENDAIIVVSAGNSGVQRISYSKTFTEQDDSFATLLFDYDYWTAFRMSGGVSIWADDDTPFEFELLIIDLQTNEIIKSYPVDDELTITSSEYDENFDETFSLYFSGEIGVEKGIYSQNSRYNAFMIFDHEALKKETTSGWTDYIVGFRIKGTPGSHVNIWCDQSNYMANAGIPGFSNGTPDNSINDMACCENIISVGSYNSRNTYTLLDMTTVKTGHTIGDASFFSSYGTHPDGRKLPDISAPGSTLISSISRFYVDTHPYIESECSECIADADNVYCWMQESGTSMSSPVVAGGIALWLEADPTLTLDDIRYIMERSAQAPTVNPDVPQWSRLGMFDAYAGLKETLWIGGVENITEQPGALVTRDGNLVRISSLSSMPFRYTVHTADGTRLINASATGEATIDLGTLPRSVIILRIETQGGKPQTLKISI